MKKFAAAHTFTALALFVTLLVSIPDKYPVNAKNELYSSRTSVSSAAKMTMQTTGITLPYTNIYFLTSDNTIYLLTPGSTSFTFLGRVPKANGNLIGIDFRPADGSATSVYGLTDTGKLLLINLATGSSPLSASVVSTLSPRFAGGFQSLMDFNPVVNALRVIGSNDQNFALVNNSGNLNQTAVQTALTYATTDVNASVDPNISAGAYTNNYVGAPNTLFYAIDYDLDTFVTISTKNATGSSNTGGGILQTIGRIVNSSGAQINLNPTADIDIYTDANGVNTLVGINNETIFTIDLNQINPALALGTTQKVVAATYTFPATPQADAFIDLAIPALAPAAAPTPTPTPTPVATTYQAENGILGGGAWVMTNWAGFTGTGFVDYADGVANSYVEFKLGQTGSRTLIFRYANGSTVNRTCNVTVNGQYVATLSFPPTGAWTNWTTTSLTVNLGTTSGARVRVTATTTNGGPNLDKVDVK